MMKSSLVAFFVTLAATSSALAGDPVLNCKGDDYEVLISRRDLTGSVSQAGVVLTRELKCRAQTSRIHTGCANDQYVVFVTKGQSPMQSQAELFEARTMRKLADLSCEHEF